MILSPTKTDLAEDFDFRGPGAQFLHPSMKTLGLGILLTKLDDFSARFLEIASAGRISWSRGLIPSNFKQNDRFMIERFWRESMDNRWRYAIRVLCWGNYFLMVFHSF